MSDWTIHPDAWLDRPRPSPRWHIDGLLPQGAWVLIVAEPKQGKSRLVQQLGHAIANGQPFLDLPSTSARVLYLDVDEPEGDILDRIADFREAGIDMHGPLEYVAPERLMRPLNVLTPSGEAWVKALMDEARPDIVILDSLRECQTSDENDSGEAVKVSHAFQRCFGARTLLLIHHARKLPIDHQGVPNPRAFGRGSSYWAGRVSSIWMLYHNVWYIEPRSGERERHAMVMKAGVWTFPGLDERRVMRDKVLALCAEHPAAVHREISALAESQLKISRATFYRYLKAARASGAACCHEARSAPAPFEGHASPR
jgi:RecA-family ATPase